MLPRRCPCGTGLPYVECCGPLHDGTGAAATAEQLMRSRYSAFALGDDNYLLTTWHPDTRPRTLELDNSVRWTGLEIIGVTGGRLLDIDGRIEFRAHYRSPDGDGVQHENSRFVRRQGRWRYLDGARAS